MAIFTYHMIKVWSPVTVYENKTDFFMTFNMVDMIQKIFQTLFHIRTKYILSKCNRIEFVDEY